jgi:hypothetical protein
VDELVEGEDVRWVFCEVEEDDDKGEVGGCFSGMVFNVTRKKAWSESQAKRTGRTFTQCGGGKGV